MKFAPDRIKIAVIGGGNIGTQFACACAAKGYSVNVLSSKPDLYDGVVEIVDENDAQTEGKLSLITKSIGEAVDACQLVFVTYPAFCLDTVAKQLLPFVHSKMNICVLPGTGGAEFAFHDCIKAGASLYGLQRVPSVARLEQYGKRVRCEGMRKELYVASIPPNKADEGMCEFMEYLWGIPCYSLPNYLSVTLTPSNPILHTTRLRVLFSDYEKGKVYDRNPLFYGEWDDASSELLIACDEELQKLLMKMDKMDLKAVRSLKQHYESNDVHSMTNKIRSIKSLHNLLSPMKKIAEKAWVPDFQSRYFLADFPYGLAIIEAIALALGYTTTYISETMNWYRIVTGNNAQYDLRKYGIVTKEDLYRLY